MRAAAAVVALVPCVCLTHGFVMPLGTTSMSSGADRAYSGRTGLKMSECPQQSDSSGGLTRSGLLKNVGVAATTAAAGAGENIRYSLAIGAVGIGLLGDFSADDAATFQKVCFIPVRVTTANMSHEPS